MKYNYPMPDQINRAFQLAYFILQDRSLAIDVATEAVAQFDVCSRYQDKRKYYKSNNKNHRELRKAIWDNAGLLELLALAATESHEIKQELDPREYGLTKEDLMVRYIKCLVAYVMARNSFHATVGICRLLNNYTHKQTVMVYDWLVPDDGGFKEDSAFRLAKLRLKKTLYKRFSEFMVETSRQILNSRTIDRYPVWELGRLVEESMRVLTPQVIKCPPNDFFEQLVFRVDLLDRTDKKYSANHVEQIRIHIVLCPVCFSRLNSRLGNPPPCTQLSLPEFLIAERDKQVTKNQPVASELPDLKFEDFYKILGENP